jgi:hypothetical protein
MKLFYVCVAWMAGIWIGSLFPLPMLAYLLSGIFAFLLALTFANKFQLGLVCVAVCLLGGARYISAQCRERFNCTWEFIFGKNQINASPNELSRKRERK